MNLQQTSNNRFNVDRKKTIRTSVAVTSCQERRLVRYRHFKEGGSRSGFRQLNSWTTGWDWNCFCNWRKNNKLRGLYRHCGSYKSPHWDLILKANNKINTTTYHHGLVGPGCWCPSVVSLGEVSPSEELHLTKETHSTQTRVGLYVIRAQFLCS